MLDHYSRVQDNYVIECDIYCLYYLKSLYGSHVACAFFSLFLEVRADMWRERQSVEKGQNNKINSSEK